MTPLDLSTLIVDKYLASYSAADGVTQSACDLSKADALASAVEDLSRGLMTSLSNDSTQQAIQSARNKVQSYSVPDNIDLVDFCSLLAKTGAGSDVTAACQDVIKAVQSDYVLKQGYKGEGMKNSNGVAIYFPIREVSPLYPGLAFSKKTGWDDFLKTYLTAIRRRP
jgi:hypothetical protein